MTERPAVNHGVQIFGGTVTGPVAGGAHARAVQYVGGGREPEISALVARLRTLVDEHEAELENPEWVRRDVARVSEELAQDAPDPDALAGTLERLARRVASVTALAEAVKALIALVLG